MLFYVRCPSCGRYLSQNLDKFLEEYRVVTDDLSLTNAEKEAKLPELLKKYHYTMMCCRIRIMGLGAVAYHEKILT